MRSITLVVLLLASILLASATKEPKCKSRCLCPRFYAPVCGISGKTHPNSCFAKCAKDVVKMKGPCPQACKRVVNKLSRCVIAKFGANGSRKRCCSWTQEGSKVLDRKCKWTGKAVYRFVRTNCYWKSRGKGKKQRFCCNQKVSKKGIRTKVGPKRCKYVGQVLSTSFKHQCAWKPFGVNGKRKYCCKTKTVCVQNKCKTQRSKCTYVGAIIQYKNLTVCNWKKVSLTKTRRQCCQVSRKCVTRRNAKTVCRSKVGKCKYSGKAIVSKDLRSCHWRTYGNKGRRQRCCTWKKVCSKGVCRTKKLNCQWKGCAVKLTTKTSCKFVTKTDGRRQKYCCTKQSHCKCNKCSVVKTSCNFVGKTFSTKKTVGCHWKVTSKNGRTRRCCKHETKCVGKKCKKTTKCKLVGLELKNYSFEKCKWKHFAKFQKRRMCCKYQKNCIGKSCKTKLVGCRFAGEIITSTKEKGCSFRKLSLTHSRKFCCNKVKTCQGKKCSYTKKRCAYKGPVISKTPKKSCFSRKYGNSLSTRKFCCKWTEYCYGKSCRPISRKCQWEGRITQRFLKSACKWTKKSKLNTMQVRCCNWVRTCSTSTLNKEEGCKNSKKRCRFVGKIINTKSLKRCSFKALGNNSKRLQCCEFKRTCQGKKNCSTKKTNKCHWKGPIHKTTSHTKCHWKKVGKKSQKRECCTWRVSCVGGKCTKVKKTCSFLGKSVGKGRRYGGALCKWRIFKSKKNGLSKRQYCCRRVVECKPNAEAKACKRVGKCSWSGKSVPLTKKFFKKSVSCKNNGKTKLCCRKVSKCVVVGKSKPKCQVIRNLCKPSVVKTQPKRKFSSCVTYGKSQVKSFKGKKFQNVFKGSFKLVQNKNVKVHVVTRRVNGKPRTVGFAAKINGATVQSITTSNDAIVLNKRKVVQLNIGKPKVVKGLTITRVSKNKLHLDAGKKGKVVVSTKKLKNSKFSRHKITVRVVKTKKTKGLCVGEHKIAKGKGLFIHTKSKKSSKKSTKKPTKDTKKVTKKAVKPVKRYTPCPRGTARVAVILCRRRGLKGLRFGKCIAHKCHKLSTKDYKRARKISRLNKVRLTSPSKKVCAATGDPFFYNFNGKKFGSHVAGDRVLYGSKSFSIHARVKKYKNGQFAISGFAVRVNKQRTIVQNGKRNGRYLVKGKPVVVKVGKTLKLKNGGSIRRVTRNKTLIYGARGQVATINRIRLSKKRVVYNIVLVFNKVSKNARGLCVNHNYKKFGKNLFKKGYRPSVRKVASKKCVPSTRKFFLGECRKAFKNDHAKVLKCLLRKCQFKKSKVSKVAKRPSPVVSKPVSKKPTKGTKPTKTTSPVAKKPVSKVESKVTSPVSKKSSEVVAPVQKEIQMNTLKPKRNLPIFKVSKEEKKKVKPGSKHKKAKKDGKKSTKKSTKDGKKSTKKTASKDGKKATSKVVTKKPTKSTQGSSKKPTKKTEKKVTKPVKVSLVKDTVKADHPMNTLKPKRNLPNVKVSKKEVKKVKPGSKHKAKKDGKKSAKKDGKVKSTKPKTTSGKKSTSTKSSKNAQKPLEVKQKK